MKLKAVEMQGFKSFPDRTKLTFDDGITVIVGPNGSGKSNISDAIKWVFGEQSVKSLRGAKMEDVIFGGSISRKPTGFAWVSLFIDNTDRSIDIDSDEVVITRRLYRSGESEYRINNNPVRLRDINEMFMDTGLGRDGYSVIEQGKIAEIVSAKSTQRREIFEEAAGISRFRYRKTEAERKLQQAEDNLVRLRDIMQELEDRVGPLKAQSEKAKQYVVLAGEKKSLEISLWLEQLAKLGRQLAELEDKTLLAANDRTTAQRRLDEIERELEEILSKIGGVGRAEVLLTLSSGDQQVLAADTSLSYTGPSQSPDSYSRSTDIVTVSGSGGTEAVVTHRLYPQYRGAVVVCDGGGSDKVRLAVTEAVSVATGLGSDRIAVMSRSAAAGDGKGADQ